MTVFGSEGRDQGS